MPKKKPQSEFDEALPQHLLDSAAEYSEVDFGVRVEDANMGDENSQAAGVSRSVLETVLLAIIQGHPDQENSERTDLSRLKCAIEALTGQEAAWTPWMDTDRRYIEVALRIAQRHGKLREVMSVGVRRGSKKHTFTSFVRLALEQIDKKKIHEFTESDEVNVTKIAAKFSGTYYTKQDVLKDAENPKSTFQDSNFPMTWYHIAMRHDYSAESLELQTADRILREFGNWGLNYKIQIPWD
jgi:hypothetical protein